MKGIATPLLALALMVPASVPAAEPARGISAEIQAGLAEARSEMRSELAKARAELHTENLTLGNGLSVGSRKSRADSTLPPAHITPAGALVIDGKPVATDAAQRQLLLDYRGKVLEVASAGIDVGEKAALMAFKATDTSLLGLIVGAMTGSLEARIERTVRQELMPLVATVCLRLPGVLDSQQALAAALPPFAPYATLDASDVADCERDMRNELALR